MQAQPLNVLKMLTANRDHIIVGVHTRPGLVQHHKQIPPSMSSALHALSCMAACNVRPPYPAGRVCANIITAVDFSLCMHTLHAQGHANK